MFYGGFGGVGLKNVFSAFVEKKRLQGATHIKSTGKTRERIYPERFPGRCKKKTIHT